jgi:molybdenum cofactor cytidylyltransferase
MGEPKQLLRCGGETLLARAVRAALDSRCRPVFVLLGAHAEALRGEVANAEAQVVVNPEWAEGMASSIRCGIAALEAATAGKARAAVLTLCDQPLVTGEVIGRLLAAYEAGRTPLVASEYEARGERTRGVPALFSRALFPELLALRGAEGAKRVIERHSSEALTVAVPEAAFDVDTPEDYSALKRDAAVNSEAG